VANFVYGDSCVSGDDKYVIAQFRQDTPMEWVAELRAFLVKDELKYKFFQPERHRVMANRRLWQRVRAGIERAEITIVDPFDYEYRVMLDLQECGAEYGFDFDDRAIYELTTDALIDGSPLRVAQIADYDWMENSFRDDPQGTFSTDRIRHRVGRKRRDAVVTAARAHAMISPSEKLQLIGLCSRFLMPNMVERTALIKKLGRVFDVEHPKSADLLNEFSVHVTVAADLSPSAVWGGSGRVVREENSRSIDHIQGADIAAGWAVDMLMLTGCDFAALARQFSWLSVNGVVIPG
jgi:hypothetical protein